MLSRRSLASVAALVAAVLLGVGFWYEFIREGAYPHEYPGADSDMSLNRALSEHAMKLPEDVTDLGYFAHSLPEGSVLRMEFVLPCADVSSMLEGNGMRVVADWSGLVYGSVVFDAERRGWRRKEGDTYAGRPKGSTQSDLESVVTHEGGRCRAYISAY